MKILTVYEADDGTRFDSRSEVMDYERKKSIKGNVVELIRNNDDWFLDDCEDDIAKFIIKYIKEINLVIETPEEPIPY